MSQVDTSWVRAGGGPGPFYERLGFVPTGELDDEIVARLVRSEVSATG